MTIHEQKWLVGAITDGSVMHSFDFKEFQDKLLMKSHLHLNNQAVCRVPYVIKHFGYDM